MRAVPGLSWSSRPMAAGECVEKVVAGRSAQPEPGDRLDELAPLVGEGGGQGVAEQGGGGAKLGHAVGGGDEGDQRAVDTFEDVVDGVVFLLEPVDHRGQPWI